MAMYVAVAEDRRASPGPRSAGTIQNDILKEYQAQKEYIFPPRPSMRLVTDVMRFTDRGDAAVAPASRSRGYHIREAGSTAAQELAFTLANGFAYVEAARRGRPRRSTSSRPALSFFFNGHLDFFEEIGKFRAARRIWARWMRDRYGAKRRALADAAASTRRPPACRSPRSSPRSTSPGSRSQALAAVLGGTQSLHTDAYDEALALPTEKAARIALRTQQVIAHETGVAPRRRPARRLGRTSSG